LKEERVLKERVNLLEKELATLTEKIDEMESALKEIGDLKIEIKGLKLFLGREHPEFKSQFPGIIKKIYSVRK
jgi:argonaute-like protein implicated in RNA metabolism and viral defense